MKNQIALPADDTEALLQQQPRRRLQREARPRITVERFNPSLYPRRGGGAQNRKTNTPPIPRYRRKNGAAASPATAMPPSLSTPCPAGFAASKNARLAGEKGRC
jgi:hypothetical protein